MAAINASVNLFALLDGNDPGDKRLVDFDSQLKDQPKKSDKKKPASAATTGYKPKNEQALKKPASAAATTKKKPTSSRFKSEKNSPPLAAGYNKAPRKNLTTPAVAASMPARAMSKQTTPAPPAPPVPVVAATAPSMAMAMNKQTTPSPQARSTNLTSVLFAYPSARDHIFKQRQEEFQRRRAKAAENSAGVSGNDDDGKSADAAALSAVKFNGKTHGVRVQQFSGDGAKQKPVVTVKEAPATTVEEPKVAPVPVVKTTPLPPPSLHDIVQFPSLK